MNSRFACSRFCGVFQPPRNHKLGCVKKQRQRQKGRGSRVLLRFLNMYLLAASLHQQRVACEDTAFSACFFSSGDSWAEVSEGTISLYVSTDSNRLRCRALPQQLPLKLFKGRVWENLLPAAEPCQGRPLHQLSALPLQRHGKAQGSACGHCFFI